MDFSPDRLRGHRHGQRLTLEQLSSLTGLTTDHLAALEAGTLKPNLVQLQALTRALDVEGGELTRYRHNPAADYCHAVLAYARRLTPDEVETAASTIRKIRSTT